jgi:hypothetical protein
VNLGEPTRQTDFDLTYSKLITERLGIRLAYGLTHLNRLGDSSVTGTSAQNFHAVLQYEAILDPPHEFLLSVQVDHEFGGTGDQRDAMGRAARMAISSLTSIDGVPRCLSRTI